MRTGSYDINSHIGGTSSLHNYPNNSSFVSINSNGHQKKKSAVPNTALLT